LNLVDALLALVILAGMAVGWRTGFLYGTLGLGVLVASLLLAFWGYQYPARMLEEQRILASPWALPAAFLGTFITVRLILGFVADRLVAAVPHRAHAHRVNRAFGVLPGFVDGLIHAMILSVLLLALPLWDGLTAQTRESEIATQLATPAEWLESRLTPIFHEAVSKTMSRMVVKPGSKESVPLAFTVKDPKPRADLEARMLELINAERAAHGLSPLRADPELAGVARAHSRDMFARGYFSHVSPDGKDPFDRIRQAKLSYRTAGENLALAPTLALAHQGLMNSPGHRANILRPAFGRVGIGIVDGGRRGQMVTQEFRN
jgi:uncharacterized protein YkwD/tetrahydromethanopterin S-methyltransferase subunit G